MLLSHVPASPAATAKVIESANLARTKGDFPRSAALLTSHLTRFGPEPQVQAMLAMVYAEQRKYQQSFALFEQAWQQCKGDISIAALYGGVLVSMGEVERGKELLLKVPAHHPAFSGARFNLAAAEMKLENYEASEAIMMELLAQTAGTHQITKPQLVTTLAGMLPKLMRLEETRTMLRGLLREFPSEPLALSIYAALSVYSDEVTPRQLYDIHMALGRKLADIQGGNGIPRFPSWWSMEKDVAQKRAREGNITIGILSADLRHHVVSRFVMPIVEHGTKHNINFICYYLHQRIDSVTVRCRKAVDATFAQQHDDAEMPKTWKDSDNWRSMVGMKDNEIAAKILADRCDVIIDFQGHTQETRVGLLTRRLAPLQGSAIGYAASSGVPGIDLRIVDSISDPTPQADESASEHLVRVDPCFLCYDHTVADELPDVSIGLDLAAPFTFACYNNLMKWSPTIIKLWQRILDAVPGARLALKSHGIKPGQRTATVRAKLQDLGLDIQRVDLIEHTAANTDHFIAYNRIDATLDTFPYHGTTTTCEALCMGVPVVTLQGDRHAARVGGSLLSAVGGECTDWVAQSPDDYVMIAAALAKQGKRTAQQRESARAAVLASDLCNASKYAVRWCAAVRNALAQRLAGEF